jgi:hypothetical protein
MGIELRHTRSGLRLSLGDCGGLGDFPSGGLLGAVGTDGRQINHNTGHAKSLELWAAAEDTER